MDQMAEPVIVKNLTRHLVDLQAPSAFERMQKFALQPDHLGKSSCFGVSSDTIHAKGFSGLPQGRAPRANLPSLVIFPSNFACSVTVNWKSRPSVSCECIFYRPVKAEKV